MSATLHRVGLSLALLLASSCAVAADPAVPDAGSILRETERTAPKPQPERVPKDLIEGPETAESAIHDVPGVVVDVKGFRFSGATVVSEEELQAAVTRFVGPGRNFQTLVDAAEAVRRIVEKKGLLLAQAYIPPQTLKDGIVEIRIIEGRLGEVLIEWGEDVKVARAVVERYLARLQADQLLDTGDLERALFLVNDLQGVHARSRLRPGRRTGTADLVVSVHPDARIEGRIDVDNYGSRYSGAYRAGALVSLNSPTGLGDSLTLRGMVSDHSGTQYGNLTYTLPVASAGTRVGGSYSYLDYELIPSTVDGLLQSGKAEVSSLFAIHPFVRSRNLNLFAQMGLDYKRNTNRLEEQALENSKLTRASTLALAGDFRDNLGGGGITAFGLSYAWGNLTSSVNDPQYTVVGPYAKLQPSFTRMQAIIGSDVTLLLRYQGQHAFDRLDSSEKFALGGPAGVRAYAPGEAPGDDAHLLTTEFRFRVRKQDDEYPGQMVLTAFYDYGAARLDKEPIREPLAPEVPNWRYLSGYGVGINWAAADWALQAALAFRDRGDLVNDKEDHQPRAYLQFTTFF